MNAAGSLCWALVPRCPPFLLCAVGLFLLHVRQLSVYLPHPKEALPFLILVILYMFAYNPLLCLRITYHFSKI